MYKRKTSMVLVALMASATLGLFACGDSDSVDLEPAILGYWIECDSQGSVYIDNDGYGWGFEVKRNGEVTTARLDYDTFTIVTDANGPFAKLWEAQNGIWDMEFYGEGRSEGTYSISTIQSGEAVLPFLAVDEGGGMAYYVKLADLQ